MPKPTDTPSEPPVPPAASRSRRRISLLSLLLITTCVALGLGVFRSSQHAERYRVEMIRALAENHRLRDEYGAFTVEDPGLLYAVAMHPDLDPGDFRDWSWRVTVPPGRGAVLRYHDGVVAAKGLPKAGYSQPLPSGLHTVRLSFLYDPEFPPPQAWRARLQLRSTFEGSGAQRSTTLAMRLPAWPALAGDDKPEAALFQPTQGVTLGTRPASIAEDGYAPDQPLVLQRMRVQTVDRKLVPVNGLHELPGLDQNADAPGFILWIEPVP